MHWRHRFPEPPCGGWTAFLILGLALAVGAGCGVPPFKRIEKRARQDLAVVTARVPLSVPEVDARLRARFAAGRTPLRPPYDHFFLEDRRSSAFPDDVSLRADADENPALQTYLQLPAAARAADYYLVDVSDTFWSSEYVYRGAPAPFRTNFLLHVTADTEPPPGATRLEIIEVRPLVWVGTRFGLGHAGPGLQRDLRVVAPTAHDRLELLGQLTAALRE